MVLTWSRTLVQGFAMIPRIGYIGKMAVIFLRPTRRENSAKKWNWLGTLVVPEEILGMVGYCNQNIEVSKS